MKCRHFHFLCSFTPRFFLGHPAFLGFIYPISKRPGEIPEQMIKTKRDTFKNFQGNLSLLAGGQEVGEESLPSTGERVSGSFELVSEGECEVIIVS